MGGLLRPAVRLPGICPLRWPPRTGKGGHDDRRAGSDDEGNPAVVEHSLADFLDRERGEACAVAVEYDADGTIIPVVYVRRNGRLAEYALQPHPLHRFDTEEHRRELAACLA